MHSSMTLSIRDKGLIIFDLDGTLAPSKQAMTPSMSKLILELLKQIKVAVISGGGFPQFQKQFLTSFPPDTKGMANLYILPTSGTKFLTWNGSWSEKYAENLTPNEKKSIIEAFNYALKASAFQGGPKTYGQIIEDRGSQITFSALGQEAPLNEKENWDPDQMKRKAIVAFMLKKLTNFDVRIGGLTSVDVTRKGVNKAYGIHKLEHYLNLPIKDMIFVGDALYFGGNDYPAKSTGIDCIAVRGPEETESLIRSWLNPPPESQKSYQSATPYQPPSYTAI